MAGRVAVSTFASAGAPACRRADRTGSETLSAAMPEIAAVRILDTLEKSADRGAGSGGDGIARRY
jgi:hypothetical protein